MPSGMRYEDLPEWPKNFHEMSLTDQLAELTDHVKALRAFVGTYMADQDERKEQFERPKGERGE